MNTGAWQAVKLATGVSTHTFTLPRSGVNTSFAFGSATITSYAWTLPSGVTYATGFSTTDDVINVVATAGYHQVSCLLTDSNSATHTAYVWLFVSDGSSTGLSLSERYGVTIDSDSQTRKGREISFTVTGDNLQDAIYPSAGIMLREFPIHGGTTLTNGVSIDTFIGYIHPDGLNFSHDGNIGKATVRAVSPFLYAEKIGQPSQALEEVSSPSHWAECTSVLSNPRGILYYAMKWHCLNFLDMHDLDATQTTPRKHFTQYNTNSLSAAMEVSAATIAGNIGSASDGTTMLKDNPLYMDNTDRNALAVILTWQEQDLKPSLNYLMRFGSTFAESRTGAFAYDGTTDSAWLAGKRWHQGIGKTELSNFTVTVADGVTRIKEMSGHYLAEQNADIQEITIDLNANQDVIDPALMLWNRLNVSSTFDPNGVGFSNERMLPTQVNRTWELTNNGWMKRLSLGLQPETFGQPGEEIPISSANTWLSGGWSSSLPVQFEPFQDDSALGSLGIIVLNDDNGKLAICYNMFASTLAYTDLSSFVDSETVHDFAIDWNSAYFTGNDATAKLAAYALTSSGSTLKVWRFNDILNSAIATELTTYTMADSSCTSEARIECSETTPTYVGVGWHDQTGVEFGYSDDGGATWQAKANVGNAVSDTANDNAPLGMAIDGNLTLISAPDSTPEYGVYKATTVGGAFSEVTNTERTDAPQPMIKIEPAGTVAYASSVGSAGNDTVTFDAGGLAYSLLAGQSGTVQSGGNPNNRLRHAALTGGLYIGITVDFGSPISITNVIFDRKSVTDVADVSITVDSVLFMAANFAGDSLGVWVNHDLDGEGAATFPKSGQVWDIKIQKGGGTSDSSLDNIQFVGAPAGTTSELFSVDPITGSAVWTDITPASAEAPERPHDLAIDLIDILVIDTVSDNSKNWYTSIDGGSNWSTSESSSNKRAFINAGDTLLEGGNAEVKISYDAGSSFTDFTGNLASIWGTVGVIKRIMSL